MRKIIQLTGILALCDDGTVWQYRSAYMSSIPGVGSVEAAWFQLPPIPQDETIEKIKEILT